MYKVNPRVDLAFKKIFGVEENKDLLISLINSIVSEKDQIVEVTLLNPYNPKNFAADKLSILDVKAKSEAGKMFNIEIQVTDEADYDKRALYYWSKLYAEQLKAGDDCSKLNKTIGIHILNFTSILNTANYHSAFELRDRVTGLVYFEDIELHTIELNKFTNAKEELTDIVKKVKDSLDIWLAFLTRHDLLNKDKLPKKLDNKVLKKALTVLEVMNFNEEERNTYEDRLKWLMIEANTLKKTEMKKAAEIAKEMLIYNEPIEKIIKYTKLSTEEIEKLKREIEESNK
ncbi:Rpn family recombination-promoting nuclease/putative transposase [Rickettsia bellii]|uniref:Putative permease n=1 Tax=Rickettsia bellii str. RML Mogi TaxID=1359194 RepID=A0A0F3QHM3_RICBE|nr:Rpn family recombination-promoting nuclease/putative transposase [Rickettsia bellii]KJV91641.1 putative permease [Rickettsia bellii str. RML Mogi]